MFNFIDLTVPAQLKAIENLRERTHAQLVTSKERKETLLNEMAATEHQSAKEGINRAIKFTDRCLDSLLDATIKQDDSTYCINLLNQMTDRFTKEGDIKELTAEQVKAKRNRMLLAAGYTPIVD